ncbi:MAG: NAD(P)/FAD-dependent oxidoreductase [Microbacterium ginsengisoli]|uniref:phytoene desaturase family protein n=1 Tax=Microbacterium TaxID=33882 RepID=UPI0006F3353A|nr:MULTISPECIES: NAD(P)/FAD-dependent oxidoreductase [unclassified Microbacterium]KQS02642.1 dehydrogenase [Microbacterium sp. Leaf347]KQS05973.1 dehydrogenase [Microbacterium sp. Leaf351]MBN9198767.1 NAD(P)/FAD-dependent oxidoreductase [Microbacterium ginsengisoli]OJU75550.1 MAG: dehydrogenase [Microbacterium sp. 71-23]
MPRATVVGSGPNGLAAAVTLARTGYEVRVLEAAAAPGGAARTAELTLPGFRHDVGSAVHPAALASPFFGAFTRASPIDWITPELSFAHALRGGAAAVWRSLDRTVEQLGAGGPAWRRVFAPLVARSDEVARSATDALLGMPRHPVTAALLAAQAAAVTALPPRDAAVRALLTGLAAHANTRLPSPTASAAGLVLGTYAQAAGWPVPRGGAGAIIDALIADLHRHGGTLETGVRVRSLELLDRGDAARGDLVMLDTSPRLLLSSPALPRAYGRRVRGFRYGAGVAKVDLALAGPVPWTDPLLAGALTVHLGGAASDTVRAERIVASGREPRHPFVIVVQPCVVDDTRAPAGRAVLWAYAHVPGGSRRDPLETVLAELERHAPGVRDLVLAAHTTTAADRELGNPNEVGGDVSGGAFTLAQAVARPVLAGSPWRTPLPGIYLCSASTPPGPAVHGMAGWHAARTALADAGTRVSLATLF